MKEPLRGPQVPLKGPRDPLQGPRGPLKGRYAWRRCFSRSEAASLRAFESQERHPTLLRGRAGWGAQKERPTDIENDTHATRPTQAELIQADTLGGDVSHVQRLRHCVLSKAKNATPKSQKGKPLSASTGLPRADRVLVVNVAKALREQASGQVPRELPRVLSGRRCPEALLARALQNHVPLQSP